MLARFKPAEHEASYFTSVLKLPPPPAEYVAAEKASRAASADMRSLTERRETLKCEAQVDNPIKTRLPSARFADVLDKLGTDIAAAQVREREALAEFDRQKTTYRESVRESLAGDIEGLGAAITGHLDQVQALLAAAASLGAEARERHVEMPGIVKDAAAAKRLIEQIAFNTIRKMTAKGAR